MEVQIFGLKKSAETRAALRFFSERRIRAHFVDLQERAIAEGELMRFIQRLGLERVLDRQSKRFEQLGLRHSNMSEGRWIEKLMLEPGLIRLPLVRRLGQGNDVSAGGGESTWKSWLTSDINKPV